ncbi:hypothetical protein LINPERHAP2_LOCUS16220 [Linum perenne]
MTTVCWNCRGIRPTAIVDYLQDLVRNYSPTIIFLSETKNLSNVVDRVRRATKYPKFWYSDPRGLSGGMALWWVADLPISVVASSYYYVHISINAVSIYYVSFLHAPNDVSERSELWETLSHLNSDPHVPWLLLGDFNAVIAPHEKQGKHPPRNDSTNAFNDFITNNHLLDMGYRGNMFTWSNNQEGEDNVKVRLDRGDDTRFDVIISLI